MKLSELKIGQEVFGTCTPLSISKNSGRVEFVAHDYCIIRRCDGTPVFADKYDVEVMIDNEDEPRSE
jgi:hypothetical protein